jgi:predicted nucleic acid-binding protein
VSLLSDGARLSHGLGIPAVDALILASLLEAGALTIYTTDEHIACYRGKGVEVVNLR